MHMHLEAKQTLPCGHFWPKVGSGGQESPWIAYLLPCMEQTALYETINWSHPFGQASNNPPLNAQVAGTSLAAFTCPSNDAIGPVISGKYARGTYAANNGLGPMAELSTYDVPVLRSRSVSVGASTVTVKGTILAGVFYINSQLTAADVSDGLSNTAFVSEVIAVPGEDMRGVLHYPEGCLYQHNHTPNSAVLDEIRTNYCVSVPQAPCTGVFIGAGWSDAPSTRSLTMTARSQHPGGVNSLLGDGSVRFVGDSVALNVWWALCTPKALPGETVSLDY
jgi:prepilin-type processing-associated H-X9-DG protein